MLYINFSYCIVNSQTSLNKNRGIGELTISNLRPLHSLVGLRQISALIEGDTVLTSSGCCLT